LVTPSSQFPAVAAEVISTAITGLGIRINVSFRKSRSTSCRKIGSHAHNPTEAAKQIIAGLPNLRDV
jgi:hypothetical protein